MNTRQILRELLEENNSTREKIQPKCKPYIVYWYLHFPEYKNRIHKTIICAKDELEAVNYIRNSIEIEVEEIPISERDSSGNNYKVTYWIDLSYMNLKGTEFNEVVFRAKSLKDAETEFYANIGIYKIDLITPEKLKI